MSDPSQTGIQLSHGIAAGIGLALAGIGRALWSAITTSKNETIALLKAERDRYKEERDKLGQEKDALQQEKLRMVGLIIAQRAKGSDDFGELPTGVRNLADLMDPNKERKELDTHPELENWDPALSTPPGLRLPRLGKKK
jgi:hypothetical protein